MLFVGSLQGVLQVFERPEERIFLEFETLVWHECIRKCFKFPQCIRADLEVLYFHVSENHFYCKLYTLDNDQVSPI